MKGDDTWFSITQLWKYPVLDVPDVSGRARLKSDCLSLMLEYSNGRPIGTLRRATLGEAFTWEPAERDQDT